MSIFFLGIVLRTDHEKPIAWKQMDYAIKPGTKCHVCKHARLTYQRDPSQYAGPWRKFITTRSLHFDKPVLCVGNTYYFANEAWMMRVEIQKDTRKHNIAMGVARLPQVKLGKPKDYRPKQRIRRDSEK